MIIENNGGIDCYESNRLSEEKEIKEMNDKVMKNIVQMGRYQNK